MRPRVGFASLSFVCLLACSDDNAGSGGTDPDTGTASDTSDTSEPTTTLGTETDEGPETGTGTETETETETETGPDEPEDCVIRVKPNGNDNLLGLTWVDAKQTLGAALDAAEAFGEPCAIWVAAGTYHPTADGDRTASFVLRPDVWVYGGFAGTELALEQRDWVANLTTLSGDIGVPGDPSDNSHHIVVAADNSRLDGFTITGGNSQGAVDRHGVGVRAGAVDFVLAHSIVIDNHGGVGGNNEVGSIGGQGGSGVGLFQLGGSLRIEDVVFRDNLAGKGGDGSAIGGFGGEGAGAFVREVSSLEIRGSSFIDNRSGDGGAGMQLGGSAGPGAGLEIIGQGAEILIVDCLFQGNQGGEGGPGPSFDAEDGFGAGLWYLDNGGGGSLALINSEFVDNHGVYGSGAALTYLGGSGQTLSVVNTVFRGNVATSSAGGLLINVDNSASLSLVNLTITGNSAPQGGGMQWNGAMRPGEEPSRLVNSIVWGNMGDFFPDLWAPKGNTQLAPLLVDHSDLAGGCVEDPLSTIICGPNNLDVDPLFEDPLIDLHLQPGSPLIDVGDASALPLDVADLDLDRVLDEPIPLDLDGLPRVVGEGIDLGAYELP
ncbi:MAG: choice-of-anchor Q domain-containing protein [Enhygromyxa sp.]